MSFLLADWRDHPTHRRVWALAAPMILSNISVPQVALVDSTVIGHLPHAHQLGAVVLFTLMSNDKDGAVLKQALQIVDSVQFKD